VHTSWCLEELGRNSEILYQHPMPATSILIGQFCQVRGGFPTFGTRDRRMLGKLEMGKFLPVHGLKAVQNLHLPLQPCLLMLGPAGKAA